MIPFGNTSKLFMTQASDNTAMNLKAKSSQGAADSDFKSVFDKSVSNVAKRSSNGDMSKNDNEVSANPEAKMQFRSFRDVRANQTTAAKQVSSEKSAGGSEIKDVIEKIEDTGKALNNNYDEQINILAQMLGISPGELVKLANELGFSEKDLSDVTKLTAFTDKLAGYMQLGSDQKNILVMLVQEVSKQTKSGEFKNGVESAESEPKGVAENLKTGDQEVKTTDLSKLAVEIKEKLNTLIQNGKTDSESISSEISKVIAAMKAQSQNKITVSEQQTDAEEPEIVPNLETPVKSKELPADVKSEVKDEKAEEGSKAAKADGNDTVKATVSDAKTQSAEVSADNDPNGQQNLQAIVDLKLTVANNQTSVEKAKFTMPQQVKNSDILNQVVEQTKIVLGHDKSEMVIQMKPDHLGKLELKIVTEQGIVAAKFIAESQQVKDIIETNMQLLKDSLQKQGISVDGVSVQVGQDPKGEFKQQNSYGGRSNSAGNRRSYNDGIAGASKAGISTLETLPERLAQYSYDSNTINLTA